MYQNSLSQNWQNKLEKSNSAGCETFTLGRRIKRKETLSSDVNMLMIKKKSH